MVVFADAAHQISENKVYYLGLPPNCANKSRKKYIRGAAEALKLFHVLNEAATIPWMLGPSLTTGNFYQQSYHGVKLADSPHYLWIYPWICHAKSSNYRFSADSSLSIDTVVTGTCLFGDHLKGLGDDGESYALTDTKAIIPSDVVIIDVIEVGKQHAYERLIYQQLALLYPLLQSIGSSDLTLQFHLPTAEYILQGIQWYQSDRINLSAFQKYINTVVNRGVRHKRRLEDFSLKTGASIVIGSPLSCLALENWCNLSLDALMAQLEEFDLPAAFRQLSGVWDAFLSVNQVESLVDLAYASYTVQIALHSTTPCKTAVVDINNEIPICLNYQRKMPDAVPVLALHWLPAVAPSNPLGSWYLTENRQEEKALAYVIKYGLFAQAATKACLTTLSIEGKGAGM